MTKREAAAIARARLAQGHYVEPGAGGKPYVYCPVCTEQVTAWPTSPGPATRNRALREALVEHLTDGWCEGTK